MENLLPNERRFYSLTARLEGLGISAFAEKAENDFDNSIYITAPFLALTVMQEETLPNNEIVSERIATIKQITQIN